MQKTASGAASPSFGPDSAHELGPAKGSLTAIGLLLLIKTANGTTQRYISPSCQAFMVPVDAVSKKNPPAQSTAAVGVPFTYTVTVPLLGKLNAAGTFNYMANFDDTTVTNVVISDDLTTTGAALSYVSNKAYLVDPGTGARTPLNGGAPLMLGTSGTWLSNHPGVLSDGSKHLVFSYENNPAQASFPAGFDVEIELTVVLDNTPGNVNLAGTQFSNSADMWFDKPINSTSMVDLQAWPGTTLPMTIVEPDLTLTKTGSVATVNVDSQLQYTLDVQIGRLPFKSLRTFPVRVRTTPWSRQRWLNRATPENDNWFDSVGKKK